MDLLEPEVCKFEAGRFVPGLINSGEVFCRSCSVKKPFVQDCLKPREKRVKSFEKARDGSDDKELTQAKTAVLVLENKKHAKQKVMTRVGFEPTQHYVMRNPLIAGKPKLESHALTARPSCHKFTC